MTYIKPTILIADDEANIRLMLRTMLESHGYQVIEAATGRDAVRMIVDETPALVLLDLCMPEGDGMWVLHSLRDQTSLPKPPVIVLTAHGQSSTVVQAIRLGARDFLDKPVTPDDLQISIAAVLHEESETPAAVRGPSDAGDLDLVKRELARHSHARAGELLDGLPERTHHAWEYFNLLGILHELEGNRRLARRFYNRAIRADPHYQPAMINLRRLEELSAKGMSALDIAFGWRRETTSNGL